MELFIIVHFRVFLKAQSQLYSYNEAHIVAKVIFILVNCVDNVLGKGISKISRYIAVSDHDNLIYECNS